MPDQAAFGAAFRVIAAEAGWITPDRETAHAHSGKRAGKRACTEQNRGDQRQNHFAQRT
jgi:hypothetical protein